jgi:hypothetical protein
LYGKQAEDINAAFVSALRLNRSRPADSMHSDSNDDSRLRAMAEQQGHPSLQTLLVQMHSFRRIIWPAFYHWVLCRCLVSTQSLYR